MRKTLSPLMLVVVLLVPLQSALAQDLSYRWQAGKTYRFQAQSQDESTMSGMGMNMAFAFTSNSRFGIKVDRVRADGWAEGHVFVEAFEVKDDRGTVVASLDGLPPAAVKSDLEISPKGDFKFTETVYVVVDEEGGNMLVSGKVDQNSGQMSATSPDGEKVTVYAEFDPKTGQLRGGMKVEKIAKQKRRRKVAVKQDKPKVEILPTQFLSMLRLPDGPIRKGQGKMDVAMPNVSSNTKANVEVLQWTGKKAKLRTVVTSKTTMDVPSDPDTDADTDSDTDAGMPGMGMNMNMNMNMDGMDLGAMMGGGGSQAQGATRNDASLGMHGDFILDFDRKQGMLSGISGTMGMDTTMGGMMSMKSKTKLILTRL